MRGNQCKLQAHQKGASIFFFFEANWWIFCTATATLTKKLCLPHVKLHRRAHSLFITTEDRSLSLPEQLREHFRGARTRYAAESLHASSTSSSHESRTSRLSLNFLPSSLITRDAEQKDKGWNLRCPLCFYQLIKKDMSKILYKTHLVNCRFDITVVLIYSLTRFQTSLPQGAASRTLKKVGEKKCYEIHVPKSLSHIFFYLNINVQDAEMIRLSIIYSFMVTAPPVSMCQRTHEFFIPTDHEGTVTCWCERYVTVVSLSWMCERRKTASTSETAPPTQRVES